MEAGHAYPIPKASDLIFLQGGITQTKTIINLLLQNTPFFIIQYSPEIEELTRIFQTLDVESHSNEVSIIIMTDSQANNKNLLIS